ncbi:uncharacterized protein BXIN_2885 [Babesia sp. Xinjiang]|uniref:uncharacterized protein n=1 Tax=Babesia sp. Xinjiang TaxID=462227 RepID=UPI000A2658BC|nr:uncharacterized protein BXIN_2885 [Babesia sp. Xinjiang]ORM39474.1 hypothetical protein BXIN_2885 [Babesia sp. Xinjiang]
MLGEKVQCVNTDAAFRASRGQTVPGEAPIAWPWPAGESSGSTASSAEDSDQKPNNKPYNYRKKVKLSNKVIKRIRSIQRLYKPSVTIDHNVEIYGRLKTAANPQQGPPVKETVHVESDDASQSEEPKEYEATKALVKSIYRSATGGVFNDALWKRYVNKLSVICGTMKPADICLVLYSFAKVRYKDQQLLKILSPLIVRHISNLSCGGAALILNAMKRLELPNYDIIELATNEICLKMDHANLQDIALTANALAFFSIYHQRFWNMLTKAISLRHHQITPLQGSLLLAALAKMDIRNPLLLRLLKDKLRPAVERSELAQELLTLTYHSLAKLDFAAKSFYNACVEEFGRLLDEHPESIDTQSLVLYLYTAVCVLDLQHQTIEKSLKLLCKRKDVLTNYKAIKLKYVFDYLKYKQPAFVENFDSDLNELKSKVQKYKLRKVSAIRRPGGLSRWSLEVSRMLKAHNVHHARNIWLDYVHADMYIKGLKLVIKCAGPFSYYAMSNKLTVFSQIEVDTLVMKGFNVCLLPYFEWNALGTDKEKVQYLKKLGESYDGWDLQEPAELPRRIDVT